MTHSESRQQLLSLKVLESQPGGRCIVNGKNVIGLCSNNYLGLASHPALKQASQQAIERYGCSTSAARLLGGVSKIQVELEEELAKFKSTEAALVFTSGYTANLGTIPALVANSETIFSDQLNHGSIIDGCRLSGATVNIYPHLNPRAVETKLAEAKGKKLIVTDTVFSMDGDIAPIPELVTLAKKYDALLMVDDAHGSGILGEHGKGALEHFHLEGSCEIVLGTLGKALGSIGGFIGASRGLVDLVSSNARSLLFTTTLPPGTVAASLEALRVLREEPELREKLWKNTAHFRQRLDNKGIRAHSQTPIIPILVGKTSDAKEMSNLLFSKDVFVSYVGYPYVPEGQARLRTIVSAQHSIDDLSYAADAIGEAAEELGINV